MAQTGTIFFLKNNPYNPSSPTTPANNNNQGVNKDTVDRGTELSSTLLITGANPSFGFVTHYAALTIDPSAQSYYFVDEDGVTSISNGQPTGTGNPSIRFGSTVTGVVNSTILYAAPSPGAAAYDYGVINDLAVDQVNKRVYFTQAYAIGGTNNITGNRIGTPNKSLSGLFYVNEAGGAAVRVSLANTLSSPDVVALDLADNIAFVSDVTGVALDGGTATAVNNLSVVNLTTGAVQILFSYPFHADGNFGSDYYGGNVLDGLAVDPVTRTLYYTTNNIFNNLATDNYGDTQHGIYKVGFSISNGTVTLGTTTTLYSGSNAGDPARIEIDTQNGVFYVIGNTQKYDAGILSVGPYDEAIYQGSLTATNTTPLTRVTPNSETTGTHTSDASDPHGAYFGNYFEGSLFDAGGIGFDVVPLVVAGSAINYVSGAGATVADAGLLTSSSTSVNYINGTVVITGAKTGDVLAATVTGTSISVNFSGSTLSLSGLDTTAHYQQVLQSVTFRNTTSDPTGAGSSISRTLTYSVFDGINTGSGTSTVAIQTAPVLSAGTPSVSFTGGGSAVAVDTVLTALDYTSTNLTGATISITSGFVSGDTLGFTTQNGIAGSYNVTGVLTLTGSATVLQYQTAIRSVTFSFSPGNGNPTAGGSTSRTLTYTATDGALTSTGVTSSITVVHAPPTMSAGASNAVTFTRGSGTPVVTDSTATVTAPDSGGTIASATVSISTGFIAGDTLAATAANGIAVAYNGTTGLLSLTGTATAAQYQGVLDGVTFSTGNAVATGTRTLSYVVNDGTANSTAVTSTVSVVVPTPSLGGTTANQAVGDNATITPFASVTFADTAGETETATLTVKAGATASDANGTLSGAGLSKTGTGTYTLSTASPAALQSALRALVFTPTANEVAPGSTVTTGFTIAVTDAGGGSTSNAVTTVVATSVNDAPAIGGTAAGQVVNDDSTITPFSGVTVGDPDVGASEAVTITVKAGATASDANGLLSGSGLSKTGTGTYTLTAGTPSAVATALRALVFTPTAQQVAQGSTVTTGFTLAVNDGITTTSNTATTVVATAVACYCRGTLILTDRGEVAVEALRIGDGLVTHAGAVRAIRWIGTRSYLGRFAAENRAVLPVLFRAGSLADTVPRRDLMVSPRHAMFLDGMLIPAEALVNGTSIAQMEGMERVDYYHLELDSHDVIWAEGAASETFIDDDSRGLFQNAHEHRRLFPDAAHGPARFCAPVTEDGPALEVVRARLAERAAAGGGSMTVAIEANGVVRAAIPAGVLAVRLVSAAATSGLDVRRLGALVTGVSVDGASVAMDDPRLARGFHAVERHGGHAVRWTDGSAVLSLPGGGAERRLEITVARLAA